MKRFAGARGFLLAGAVAMGIGLASGRAMAQKAGPWKLGTPIVTYWAGPAMTDAAAQQLADGGWNLVWCTEKELDVAQRHRLRAQLTDPLLTPSSLDDPVKRAALDALIDRVRKHPALYSYFLTDEPSGSKFLEVGRLLSYVRSRDPAHLVYINLFPINATNEQLGYWGDPIPAYQEYLQQFIDVVKPTLLSYDHYQFAAKSDTPDYFLNIALVRRAAMDAGLPFLNIVQACTWTPRMREPGEAEMRYLVYTTLAYGAMGISYYVYSHPDHTPGIATLDGKPTRVYDWLQKLNPEFASIASQVQSLRSTGVYHAGMMPPGAEPLPKDSPFLLDPPVPAMEFKRSEPVKGALLGCFGPQGKGKAGPSHVVVVNLDYQAENTLILRGPATLEVFDTATRKWTSCHDTCITLHLPPGGGKLVRIMDQGGNGNGWEPFFSSWRE